MVESLQISFQHLYEKKREIVNCNKLYAKLIDVILGIVAIYFFIQYEGYIVETMQVLIEVIKILIL